jgi:cytochrome c oxidase assembly protein subunit 15
MVLFALVVIMIAVGGLTRLTDSGLSITEWKPVTGALPPMDAGRLGGGVRQIPRHPRIPAAEQGHEPGRVQGDLLVGMGAPAAGPRDRAGLGGWVLRFLLRRDPAGLDRAALAFGRAWRAQGAIGWWMVFGPGGHMLDVASYRLAVHLGLAFVILGLIAWYVILSGS